MEASDAVAAFLQFKERDLAGKVRDVASPVGALSTYRVFVAKARTGGPIRAIRHGVRTTIIDHIVIGQALQTLLRVVLGTANETIHSVEDEDGDDAEQHTPFSADANEPPDRPDKTPAPSNGPPTDRRAAPYAASRDRDQLIAAQIGKATKV